MQRKNKYIYNPPSFWSKTTPSLPFARGETSRVRRRHSTCQTATGSTWKQPRSKQRTLCHPRVPFHPVPFLIAASTAERARSDEALPRCRHPSFARGERRFSKIHSKAWREEKTGFRVASSRGHSLIIHPAFRKCRGASCGSGNFEEENKKKKKKRKEERKNNEKGSVFHGFQQASATLTGRRGFTQHEY